MKEIKATIRPYMFDKVLQALHELPHFPGVTSFRCQGQGRGRGAGGAYVLKEEDFDSHALMRVEIVCADQMVDEIVQTIVANAHTGNPGDGLVTVADIMSAVRIRTGETDDQAL